jgi:hypothetical protein
MDAMRIDDVLWDLEPDELPDALRLLSAMETVGWVSAIEAGEWRGPIAALGVFHEDPHLWIEGPEA